MNDLPSHVDRATSQRVEVEATLQALIADLDAQLADREELMAERDRLRKALAVLSAGAPTMPATVNTRRQSAKLPKPAARTTRPRNSVRDAILRVVRDDPGIDARGVAERVGITRNHAATTMGDLTRAGVLERVKRGKRRVGFRPARAVDLRVLSQTGPTERELKDREVAYVTSEPA